MQARFILLAELRDRGPSRNRVSGHDRSAAYRLRGLRGPSRLVDGTGSIPAILAATAVKRVAQPRQQTFRRDLGPQIRTQRRDHRLLMLVATRIRVETVPDQIIAHVTGHARNLHRCDMHIRMDDAHRRLPCDGNMAVPLNRVTHACSFRSSQRIAFRHLHYERSPGVWSSRTVNLAVACGRRRILAPARTRTVRVSTGCAHGSGGSSPCRSSRPARRRPAGTTCRRWLRQ